MNVKHIVMFSGGVCSWAAAKRVVKEHGKAEVILLFADTKMEDEDLYRFLPIAAANVGGELVIIADGRTPWEVMRDHRMIFKPRVPACSRVLKREMLDAWRDENGKPDTICYVGIDWTEPHRYDREPGTSGPNDPGGLKQQMSAKGWRYEAPMTQPPYLTKAQMLDWLKREGLNPPRLYEMGFPHNNCGGFCIKAGQAHFAHLLKKLPERFAYHEGKEEEMRKIVGDYSILRDRTGGTTKTLTLRELRKRIENKQTVDLFEWGGCGCSVE